MVVSGVRYAHKIKVYALHGRGAWTWNHRGNHKQHQCTDKELLTDKGNVYGHLYWSWKAAYEAAREHAGRCVCEGR